MAALARRLEGVSAGNVVPEIEVEGDKLREATSMKLGLVRDRVGLEGAIKDARAIHTAADAIPIRTHGDIIAISELKDLCEATPRVHKAHCTVRKSRALPITDLISPIHLTGSDRCHRQGGREYSSTGGRC